MARQRPRISVLLPAFNAGRTIDRCLRSIQRQTEPRWECLVVDDGSTDETPAVAAAWAARDSRLVVLPRQGPARHEGLVPALRRGLEQCAAPYVARMDGDDIMHRERLASQLTALERDTSLSAVGCRVRVFPRAGLRDGLRRYERWLNTMTSARTVREEAYVECPIAHPSLMVRREVLCELGYRDRGWPEDYDLVLRLLAGGHEIGIVPRRLLFWRDGPTRLWRTAEAYSIDRFTACKAYHLARGFLAGAADYVLWGYGGTGRRLRRALAEHGKLPSHIVELHPGRLGQIIHGAPVIAPEALGALRGRPVVVSVAGEQARGQIRAALGAMGFGQLDDYVCCA